MPLVGDRIAPFRSHLKRELNVYCIASFRKTLKLKHGTNRKIPNACGSEIFKMQDAYWTTFESSLLHVQ